VASKALNENMVFNGIASTWQDALKVIDELGGPNHFSHFPAEWAWAMDTPFQYVKPLPPISAVRGFP
jgi:hypothetical protein